MIALTLTEAELAAIVDGLAVALAELPDEATRDISEVYARLDLLLRDARRS